MIEMRGVYLTAIASEDKNEVAVMLRFACYIDFTCAHEWLC